MEASIELTGKRRLEAMTKLCLGLGNWSCLSWVKKQQARSSECSSDGQTLPIMYKPFTCDSKLYAVAVKKPKKNKNKKKKSKKPKKPREKLQNFKRSDEEKAVSILCFQEIPPGKPYKLLVLQV